MSLFIAQVDRTRRVDGTEHSENGRAAGAVSLGDRAGRMNRHSVLNRVRAAGLNGQEPIRRLHIALKTLIFRAPGWNAAPELEAGRPSRQRLRLN